MWRTGVRWCLASLSVACVALAGVSFSHGREKWAAFNQELARTLASSTVDLSVPGSHRWVVETEYPHGHGFVVVVQGARPGDGFDPKSLRGLEGVAASWRGPDDILRECDVVGEYVFGYEGDWQIARIAGWSQGKHHVELTIKEPASKLAGMPVRVSIKNSVCGCELMGVAMFHVLEAFAIILALAMGLIAWRLAPGVSA